MNPFTSKQRDHLARLASSVAVIFFASFVVGPFISGSFNLVKLGMGFGLTLFFALCMIFIDP